MIVHTAVHSRLDVVELWVRSMRAFAPWAELHVWYSDQKPPCGDVLHQMPHVGIGAARWVYSQLPKGCMRVFVESDMIAVRPWSLDEYPDSLHMLEGSPGRRWFGITIARPGVSHAAPPTLIRQRYVHDGGCPDWLPAEFREQAILAQAKVAGSHWLHLDKMHRPQGNAQPKTDLMAMLRAWLPEPSMGLGDMVAAGLERAGITKDRVSAALGGDCGCAERQQRLNRLGKRFGIG